MTTDEMSAAFDLKYNNIMSNLAPGLNEYEKSYFLTEAQKSVLTQLCASYDTNPSVELAFRKLISMKTFYIEGSSNVELRNSILSIGMHSKYVIPSRYHEYTASWHSDNSSVNSKYRNILLDGYPGSAGGNVQARYIDTDGKMKGVTILVTATHHDTLPYDFTGTVDGVSNVTYTSDSYLPRLDNGNVIGNKMFKVLYEDVLRYSESPNRGDAGVLSVIPISYSELARLTKNPYPFPAKHTCWRLGSVESLTSNHGYDENALILIPPYGDVLQYYRIHYVGNPSPIILTNLGSDASHEITIDGGYQKTDMNTDNVLHASVHHMIVDTAVMMAKAAMSGQGVPSAGGSQKEQEE